ncbi:MAG: septation regulator SpoVG [Candidatus Krumholzibacteriia bacterium]
MLITEVRISLRDDAKLKAFASITLDDCFVIRGLKIISGQSGTFVAMPSRKRKDGDYQDIAHPINNTTRKWMEDIVLEKYREEVGKQGGESERRVAGSASTIEAPIEGQARQESREY